MKKLCVLMFFVVFGSLSFAQESTKNNPESELLKVYTQAELKEMKESSPENYKALLFGLEKAVSIETINFGSKKVSLQTLQVDMNNVPSFAELGIKITNENQYFRIAGSDKILMVKSFYLLKNKF